ncbi:MAG: thioredoxin fold domain-containing protein [Flavobacteriaceae bacterium]|nr:thioredoxin fold domain-containing protein [Flavobacteriaceae bacterium]
MKKVIVLFIALTAFNVSINAQGAKINWITMNEALENQARTPKKIMMDAYTNWCGPCKMLDKNTFQNTDVVKYVNDNYYAVKFNAEGNEDITYKGQNFGNPNYDASKENSRNAQHQLSQALQVRAYPTIIFFNEKGDVIAPITGYKTPAQLELYLKLFVNDTHNDITTKEAWDKYQNEFKFEFKG